MANIRTLAASNDHKENPIDYLKNVAACIAALFDVMPINNFFLHVNTALIEYELPFKRRFTGRGGVIRETLIDFQTSLAQTTNIPHKPVADLYKRIVTEEGGNNTDSFNTCLLHVLIGELKKYDLSIRLQENAVKRLKELILIAIDERLENENTINEQQQKIYELNQLSDKHERELLKTRADLVKCETQLKQLTQVKSGKKLEIIEYTEKLQQISQEEIQKKQELADLEREKIAIAEDLRLTKEKLEEESKRYGSLHPDFTHADLSKTQIEMVEASIKQATLYSIAAVKGKAAQDGELSAIKKLQLTQRGLVANAKAGDEALDKFKKNRLEELEVIRKLRETKQEDKVSVSDIKLILNAHLSNKMQSKPSVLPATLKEETKKTDFEQVRKQLGQFFKAKMEPTTHVGTPKSYKP